MGDQFQIGKVLGRTFSIFLGGFINYTAIAAVPLASYVFAPLVLHLGIAGVILAPILMLLLWLPLNFLAQGVLFYLVIRRMRKSNARLSDSLKVAVARLPSFMGVSLLVFLALGCLATIGTIAVGVMLMAARSALAAVGGSATVLVVSVIASMGAAATIAVASVCWITVLLSWSLAPIACFVERSGPFGSLHRSRQLTKGHRWRLFGLFLLMAIVIFLFGRFVLSSLFIQAAHGAVPAMTMIAITLCYTILAAFGAVLLAVIYHDLRIALEGADLDQVAKVFE